MYNCTIAGNGRPARLRQKATNMTKTPRSAYDMTEKMAYFPRMLDKIRLYAQGELRADFHDNLGKGIDARCVDFLRVTYEDLRERVLAGGSDEEILQWCFSHGRALNANDQLVWSQFVLKMGWNDRASAALQERKVEAGWGDRTDIQTFAAYFEVDEGRQS